MKKALAISISTASNRSVWARHSQHTVSQKKKYASPTRPKSFTPCSNSLELCQFVYGPTWTLYDGEQTAEMVRAVTGWDITLDELMAVGRRRLQLFRTFNAREGLGRKDDRLPKKFFKALKGTGPTAGFALTHEEVDSAIDHYYKLAGLNADGAPTPDVLKKLDLEWAAEYLPA
ncbi:MAG: aldehyde ferredoxin oxidoreductase C-terminal domain-containing protein [Anaerolineales bacterium]